MLTDFTVEQNTEQYLLEPVGTVPRGWFCCRLGPPHEHTAITNTTTYTARKSKPTRQISEQRAAFKERAELCLPQIVSAGLLTAQGNKKEKKENSKKPHKVRFSWFSFTKHLKRHPWIQLVKSNKIKQWTIHKIIRGPTKNNQTHRATRHESTGLAKAAAWHQVCSKVTITAVNYFNWQTTSKCGIIL